MLLIFIRVVFVLLAMFIGATSGDYFYGQLAPNMPPWTGAVMGFAVAVTMIAIEQAFRRHFNRTLVAFLIGLSGGLILSYLILAVVDVVIQNTDLKKNLDIPIALVATYLVLTTVLRNADRFRLVVPFVEFRSDRVSEGSLVVDGSALADGRLRGLLEAGLLDHRLIVHRSIIATCEGLSQSEDPKDQLRGQRALTILADLRENAGQELTIDDSDLPQAESGNDILIGLARLENCRLCTADQELADRARAEGLRVLDIATLGKQLAPALAPGEIITVALEKPGENKDQGVGYLDDGSMAVVNGGKPFIGHQVRALVVRLHHTRNGRMVFADHVADEVSDSSAQRRHTKEIRRT